MSAPLESSAVMAALADFKDPESGRSAVQMEQVATSKPGPTR